MICDDTPDTLTFKFESPQGERDSEYEVKLSDIDTENLGIPVSTKKVFLCRCLGNTEPSSPPLSQNLMFYLLTFLKRVTLSVI